MQYAGGVERIAQLVAPHTEAMPGRQIIVLGLAVKRAELPLADQSPLSATGHTAGLGIVEVGTFPSARQLSLQCRPTATTVVGDQQAVRVKRRGGRQGNAATPIGKFDFFDFGQRVGSPHRPAPPPVIGF